MISSLWSLGALCYLMLLPGQFLLFISQAANMKGEKKKSTFVLFLSLPRPFGGQVFVKHHPTGR